MGACILTQRARGANERIAAAFLGTGRMGRANLRFAMQHPGLEVVSLCDVFRPNLEKAMTEARKGGHQPKAVVDFREILADPSVDVVCVSTPDHWHAYMTVEACKGGKDVYVEKPLATSIDEASKMLLAARRCNRVVQAGTMQRSAAHFRQACNLVRQGKLGKVTFVRTFNWSSNPREGIGNPPDGDPPSGLDWDLWLGPAPKRPFNPNRFGVNEKRHSFFRWFWDYAGGMITDWGVHWLDIVQMAFGEAVPVSVQAFGGKLWYTDNRETPDTLHVTYCYPEFLASYEHRSGNGQSMFDRSSGVIFHGSDATLFVDRTRYSLIPEKKGAAPVHVRASDPDEGNSAHWADFLACVRNRKIPVSDIETCFRSTSTCLLGNIAYLKDIRIDWDLASRTIRQEQAAAYLSRPYRTPWTLTVEEGAG